MIPGKRPTLHSFVALWRSKLKSWRSRMEVSMSRKDILHLIPQLLAWHPTGTLAPLHTVGIEHIRKGQKKAHGTGKMNKQRLTQSQQLILEKQYRS